MLYSKNGSIPKPETDGTEGWIEVEEAPIPGEGQEVVWWFPPGWVVRPPMPVEPGYFFKWSQTQEEWMRFATPVEQGLPVIEIDTETLSGEADSIGSASDTISGA
jgi:hypothetical protein